MLEDQVAYLLQRYLGNYVSGLSRDALSISVWQGDVELTNMQLKPEALNALQLPVKVKAGFLGSVKLKVPWSRLGQDPVSVYLDRIFLLAEPETEVEGPSEDAVQEAKKSRIQEMERKLLERAQILKSEVNSSWLGSLINIVIGNLKLSISNIHIRYEDHESNPGHPFAAGVTLGKLSAVTIDEYGMETFVTGETLDCIQKSVELDQLALYLDSDISPWYVDKPWKDLLPSEWVQIFRFGTNNGKQADCEMRKHSYILQPVSGNAKYSKLSSNESTNSNQPLQKAAVNLDDVTLCLSKNGYRDVLKLADNFAAFNQRLKYAHYRPLVSVKSNPRFWWRYAYRAVSDQMKAASGMLSWDQVLRYANLLKRYISLYASLLKSDPNRLIIDGNEEIEEMDRQLDIEVIIRWRMLAHMFVEQSVDLELYSRKERIKKSWWSFGRGSQSPKHGGEQFRFSEDDWRQLNKLIGYKEGDNEHLVILNEKVDVLRTFLEVHMQHSASKLVDGAHECLAELSCEDFSCSVKLYPETQVFDLKLGSYRLSSPSGLLAESADASDSLVGVFCYKPFDAKVDWSMVVKASPCYMTYLKDSVDEIIKFFESNDAHRHTIALETATAVQMTIDGVKRTAQQQVNRALMDESRFLLDLDIAAPKITIPTYFHPDNINSTKLLLDLGNLVIQSQDEYDRESSEDLDLYLQVDLALSDMSAFLVDGDYKWSQTSLRQSANTGQPSGITVLPVIDRCGVIIRVQQIKLLNPSYPSTRISVQMPSLGFHFSPARYHRLMQVAKVFQDGDVENSNLIRPWYQADIEGWLHLLIRRGMANREAVWQRQYLCLVGPFLYVLESPKSRSYKHYVSLRGKQIYQLPKELVGEQYLMAICDAGRPIKKVVEDVNVLVVRFDCDDLQRHWQSRLHGAIYRASGTAPVICLSESSSDADDSEMYPSGNLGASDVLKMERLFLTGVLDELKISFSYNHNHELSFLKVLLAEESPLFEYRALGGQVELSVSENEMLIGTVLKSLEIEDLVCGNRISRTSFLARSVIGNEADHSSADVTESLNNNICTPSKGKDNFYEASENLDSKFRTPQNLFPFDNAWLKPPRFSRVTGLLPTGTVQNNTEDVELTHAVDSFVKAQIVICDQSSFLYKNIDMQVSVTLATLSFFCRRPTILAIMEFVNAINIDIKSEALIDLDPAVVVNLKSSGDDVVDDPLAGIEKPFVKDLLGKGKSKIIFNIILNMAHAQIFLMNENETRLASFSQENLLTDIKVFPSSYSIKAALGNLRISDESLPGNHSYFWICDMRDPGGSSFVELVFTSFSPDDEDYEGFEYSLLGQLSEVRIVYLNRFVQEIVSYFMGLVPYNYSNDVIKLKDQVTNSEKSFTTSEIEGLPALKLDLSLKKPIILMPSQTSSPDYLKLDVVHITIRNTFNWLHGGKSEINAVHVETLTIQVENISLNVGSGTELGESTIRDVKGISISIQRSLRDLLNQIPSTEAAIEIGGIKMALSNKEYLIITECALTNIYETPNIVPPLKHDSWTSAEMIEPIVDQNSVGNETESQNGEAWISMKVSVHIKLVELSLLTGVSRDAPLATIQVAGAWLLYKSSNIGESFLSATFKGFSVIDDRLGTEEEFRLVIGKPEKNGYGPLYFQNDDGNHHIAGPSFKDYNEVIPTPAMLILDANFGPNLTHTSVYVQRPQLLVALDFLLPFVEFFVPAVGSMLSNDESKEPSHVVDIIALNGPIYRQPFSEFSISPSRPLIVDDERFDHFVYDGEGGILYLKDRQGHNLSAPSKEAIIHVGSGKNLQFKNVVIKNGKFLDSCILLGSNSSYIMSKEDAVYLEEEDETSYLESSRESINDLQSQNPGVKRLTEFIFEFQAIGPELTFYSASREVGISSIVSNKLLHTHLDAFSRLVSKGDMTEMTANARGLTMESNGIRILEPFDASFNYSNASGKTNIHISVSNVFMNVTFSILRLFLAVEDDILAFLRTSSKQITVTCSEFDKVGTIKNSYNDLVYNFWRPRAPPGYAVLGHYLTPGDKPPTKRVVAVNMNFARVKLPTSFKLIWPPSTFIEASAQGVSSSNFVNGLKYGDDSCFVWFPEAPEGYVALGCVVSAVPKQPPLSSGFCISDSLVSTCSVRDCVAISTNPYSSSLSFWRVKNSFGTFLPSDPTSLCMIGGAYELCHLKFGLPEFSPKASKIHDTQTSPSEKATSLKFSRRVEAVASFQLIWWNRNSSSRKKISVWRPVAPEGMFYFGDIAVKGYEPPNTCIVFHDTGDEELFKAPLDYQLVGHIKKHRGMECISFWIPQAPPGFVSLGCIACNGSPKLNDFCRLRCMRSDMVTRDQFLEETIWNTSEAKFVKEPFSMWTVGNELRTFIVRSGFRKPPRRFALKLADPNVQSGSDDTTMNAVFGTFSASIFDDYGGLMVPLFNISLSGIGFNLHGRTDSLNSTVSFSLDARSYNDKLESWEPLVEPVDGFLRYQYDLNAPGAASQLRFTTTRDLNLNVTVSNMNMIIQAYASWNNLHVHEFDKNKEVLPSTYGAKPVMGIHQKKNYYIIQENKLGQEIFICATKVRGPSDIIRMPSGDMKPVKVLVSENMLDSHLEEKFCRRVRAVATVVIMDAELPRVEGLTSNIYTVALCLTPHQGLSGDSPFHQQSARTSGSISNSTSSELELVNWNEIFFFRVDIQENYDFELIVSDMGKGDAVGVFSASLNQIAKHLKKNLKQTDYLNYSTWIDLSPAKHTTATQGDKNRKSCGRIKCAVLLSPGSEDKDDILVSGRKSELIQISPSMDGPWTTLRLNYAAPAACCRFGNEAVASEVSVKDGNRLVTIRSLVSVRNKTDFILDLHLVSKASINASEPEDSHSYDEVQTDEFFETEVFKPTVGWVGCSNSEIVGHLEGNFKVELPTDWEWIDDWHLDTSSVDNPEGWVYSPDVESLKWPDSYNSQKFVNHARLRRWVRNRRKVSGKVKQEIPVGLLKPGDSVPLPLPGLKQIGMYVLQLRPSSLISTEYSWSSVVNTSVRSAAHGQMKDPEICVSTLKESEELLYCTEIGNTSTNGSHKLWFCVSIQATQIAKGIHSDPILDWSLVVKSPLKITNFLPLVAEYSVLEMQTNGYFIACQRGILSSGKAVNVYTADIGKPLFFSLLPQGVWLPTQEVVLISHPTDLPSKTMNLRSSISGRIVQVILEQNYEKEQLLLAKTIRVYAPYWFSIARCPPLTYRLVDLTSRRNLRKIAMPFESRKSSEVILGEITEEEVYAGYTIASDLNFNVLGLSVSIAQTRQGQHFEPVRDLSSLGDMDGSLDLYAYDADGNCMRLFISSKPCPYHSVPTKVISIRPFITFTNRLGQDIYIKLSSDDEPKKLHAFDSRISFVYRKTGGTDKLQVRLEDTGWSFPVQITKEDTIFLVVRRSNGTRQMLRTEIRGFEEGSRFIVVFRVGSTDGPIRIENRAISKTVSIRQSGFGDDEWIMLEPLSTTNFSWEDPYGQKIFDAKIDCDGRTSVHNIDLESAGNSPLESAETALQFHVIDFGDIKICRFTDNMGLTSHGERNSLMHWGNLHGHGETENEITPLELIVELGVVGISVVDHRPKELSYFFLEGIFVLYSTGYDGGTTSRFKLTLGCLQFDNQLPLSLMPVLLAPEQTSDIHNPVFNMTITQRNENSDGIQFYPYVYIRVTEQVWRLNIHEPIIWAMIDFYDNLQLDRVPQSSSVTHVDPEIHVGLIDVSEIRIMVSLETARAQRPHGVLGVWSPILSAVGNTFKVQVNLRGVMHRDRFARKSSIVPATINHIWRGLIHNPLRLISSVNVLGMTSSALAALSKGLAELSSDGQFLQLRSKQVLSRRITGLGDGIVKGTEALAQSVAFGVSGVLTKPMESARLNGPFGLANGFGHAFLGFIVQPLSGAFDFFSLAVDGIGASCSKCLEGLSNKTTFQRIRHPRAIGANCILRDYSEKEAMGQMIIYLAEASRRFGYTEIFKEPSKFACSDYFEELFFVPYQRIVLVSNKRAMLLQWSSLDKIDNKPSKIMWDVPWEDLLALELAKEGHSQPSRLLLHLKNFRKSENFAHVIKCNVEDESDETEPQAVRICSAIRRVWKTYQSDMNSSTPKVPSSQRHVYFYAGEADEEQHILSKTMIKSRELCSSSTASDEGKFIKHSINFAKIWSSEREPKGGCRLCREQDMENERICSVWTPICPIGYVSIGDIAHVGIHPPKVAAIYRYTDRLFTAPIGYDLVWRNCLDDYKSDVSIWHPRAPEGFVALGFVAVDGFEEPETNRVWCVAESIVELTDFDQKIWSARDSFPWECHIYQVRSDSLHFAALGFVKEDSDWKPMRVVDDQQSS